MNNADKRLWRLVYTNSRSEKSVAKQLLGKNIAAFVPCWKHVVVHNKKKYVFYPPLFPGYAFAKISDEEYLDVLSARGVVHVVNGKNSSMGVNDSIAHFLQSSYCRENARPHEGDVGGTRVFLCIGTEHRISGYLDSYSHDPLFVFSMPMIDLCGCVAISKDVAIENAE